MTKEKANINTSHLLSQIQYKVVLSMTRKDELISRSETSEPGNISLEETQSQAAQRVKQLPKCQGHTTSESHKDF